MGTGIGTGIGKLNTAPITDGSISKYLIDPFTAFRKSPCLCASVFPKVLKPRFETQRHRDTERDCVKDMGTGIGTGIGKLNTAPITDCSISKYLIDPFTAFRKSPCLCASVFPKVLKPRFETQRHRDTESLCEREPV